MEPFFADDPLFETFAERALSMQTHGPGAEYGECLATSARITAGDVASWHREWVATANRLASQADESAARGHDVSAREAYLRAATYYRTSYFPLFGQPVDPRLVQSFDVESRCFAEFARRAWPPIEAVEIPFEGTSLPGYLCLAASAGPPRPTVVTVNGYDSNVHEMYWAHAVAAVRRGYHCLLVDGPGQGRALIKQGLHLRPNWETVVRPVVDWLLERPEVDPAGLVLLGWSFGGFLAPRAATGEPRLAALIADPGQWDQLEALRVSFPLSDDQKARLPDLEPAVLEQMDAHIQSNPMLRWRVSQRALWTFGLDSLGAYLRQLAYYTISDVVEGIGCPTLVAWAEDDPIACLADRLYQALRCPKAFVRFTAAEGASGHCEAGNRSLFHQRTFDWLDEVLGAPRPAAHTAPPLPVHA
jgi:pimeloyl-ACP methyl ester carboxylesterase